MSRTLDRLPPDEINSVGVKFWANRSLTEWASQPDQHGITLPNLRAYAVEEISGRRTYLLTDGDAWIFESQRLEDVAVRIDILKIQKRYERCLSSEALH